MLTENPKIGLACLIIGAVIAAVGMFLACSKKFRQQYGDGFGAAMFAAGALVMFATILFVPDKSDTQLVGNVSDMLAFDELEITVNDYVFSEYLGNLKGLGKAEDGNIWCTVYLDVKNASKSTKSLKSSFNTNYNFELDYNDGYTYNTTWPWENYSEFLYTHDNIAPLATLKNVCVSFKVPVEVQENSDAPLYVRISKNSKTEKDYVEWKIR